MAQTTQRVLRLLSLMQSRATWTGPELAARLGITDRTVRRDVDRLRELGYPVEAGQGVGGGYRLGAGGRLPPLLLDDEEAVAVAVCLRVGAGSSVEGIGEAALRTLTKLDQVLPARLRAQVAAVGEATVLLPGSGAGPRVDPDLLVTLARATTDRVRLRFAYDARSGERTDRDVEPYRLVTTGRRWYLFAWDIGRGDWRTFRLDRMTTGARATTYRFRPREAPDAAEYVQRAVTRSAYHVRARARFGCTPELLAQRVPATVGTVGPVPGRESEPVSELVTGAERLEDLAYHLGWIAHRLDCTLEVLEPTALADELVALGERFARSGR